MARTVLEQTFPPDWIDDVLETHRRYPYARELLFSTIVDLMTLVVLGPRPPLHAAARRSENLPVSLTALYDKVNRDRAGDPTCPGAGQRRPSGLCGRGAGLRRALPCRPLRGAGPRAGPARVAVPSAVHIRSGYDGLVVAQPSECWPGPVEGGTAGLVERLLRLARRIDPERVAACKRGPKTKAPKGHLDARTARAHVATARVIAKAKMTP